MNKNSIFVFMVLIFSILAQLSLRSGVDWLQFARADIEAGQWWRIITGNFVHLSWRHFVMNAAAFLAIYALYPKCLKPGTLILVFLFCCLSVTAGIWLFSPEIHWYVGLSGTLHGLLLTLLIVDYLAHKHVLNIILLAVVIAKLVWEGMMGPLPGSETSAGGPVVPQAHLYGFVGGLVAATSVIIFNKNKMLSV